MCSIGLYGTVSLQVSVCCFGELIPSLVRVNYDHENIVVYSLLITLLVLVGRFCCLYQVWMSKIPRNMCYVLHL